MLQAYNPSTQAADTGGSLQVRGQPGLKSECKASINCIVRPCLKKAKKGNFEVKLHKMQLLLKFLKHNMNASSLNEINWYRG